MCVVVVTTSVAMRLVALSGCVLAATAVADGPSPVIGYPVVDTTLGKLRGVTVNFQNRHTLHAFRGIRYTDAPVNERRFLRAELMNEKWSGVQNATAYGAICIQNPAGVSCTSRRRSRSSLSLRKCCNKPCLPKNRSSDSRRSAVGS